MADQATAVPTRKVAIGALAGGITIIVVWVAKQFGAVDIPNEVAQAFTLIVGTVTAYFVPNAD